MTYIRLRVCMFLTNVWKTDFMRVGWGRGVFLWDLLINQHLPDKTRTGRYANGTNDIGIPVKDGKCYDACKIIFEHKNVTIKKSINKTTMFYLNLNSVFSL